MRGMRSDFDPDKKIDWSVVKEIWPYLMEYRVRVLIAVGCLFGAKLASVGMPFVLKHVVDDLDQQLSSEQVVMVGVPLALLLAYGVVRLSNSLLGEIRDTLFGRVTERAMRRIGLKVFEHLHSLHLAFHLDRRTGGLSRDIERGTNGISFLMRFLVFNIVPTFLELFLVMGILWSQYRFEFALIVLVAVVAYVWFSKVTTDWRTQFIREANSADSQSSTRAIDSLINFETVKYFNNEQYEADLYDKDLKRWEQAKRKNRLTLFALNGGQALIISVALTSMLILAAYEVANGRMTLGDFVLVNAFMMQIFLPLNFLGFVYREIKSSMANIEKMFELLKVKNQVCDPEEPKVIEHFQGHIQFENVSFSYDEREILKDLSFEVKPGQRVALVGSSGAGKSTISKLLYRFYDVTAGRILIDGMDIRDLNLSDLRSHIGVVPQDTVLFNANIFENIRYGDPGANEEQVLQAVNMAHLQEFVSRLPKGLDTQVGERGLKLSGGEKQRVAIARTMLKQPEILVFDEATSSLDSRSEKAVMEAMNEVARGRSSISIAHRLSTVVNADRILVVDSGQIVEQGSHSELLAQKGRYFELWQMQQSEAGNP